MPDTRAGLPAIWTDGLGRASIRSLQVLAVAAFAWAVLWTLTRVPLVIIPATIAVILAAAIAPLVRWLAGHGFPRALAVAASFLAIVAVFGGVVTGIVFLVRSQWKELSQKAVAGVDQLHTFLNTGPIPVSDEQINTTRESVQKFFTSSFFGSAAITGARTVPLSSWAAMSAVPPSSPPPAGSSSGLPSPSWGSRSPCPSASSSSSAGSSRSLAPPPPGRWPSRWR